MKLDYSDGRQAKVGETLSIKSNEIPRPCHKGMHASTKASQAAGFKKGLVLCRVMVHGDVKHDTDKFCGRHRTIIWAKELDSAAFTELKKALGYRHSAVAVDTYTLRNMANFDSGKFDKAMEAWAKKNGWTSDELPAGSAKVKIEFVKQQLTKDILKKFLSDKFVTTEKELRKHLDAAYELDNASNDTLGDMLYNMSTGYKSTLCVVDSYTEAGEDGYVLRQKRKR